LVADTAGFPKVSVLAKESALYQDFNIAQPPIVFMRVVA